MCCFDPSKLKKTIDDEIEIVEAQIAEAKASSKERNREKLAELMLELEDGKILELGAKKHAKFEAELRAKVKAELRKEFETEYAAKIAEAMEKMAAETKI